MRIHADRRGNFGIIIALLIPLLIVAAGGVIDVFQAMGEKARIQNELDAAVLAAVLEQSSEKQLGKARSHVARLLPPELTDLELAASGASMALASNKDGSLTGRLSIAHPTIFLKIIHVDAIPIDVSSTAIRIRGKSGEVDSARLVR